MCRTKQFILSGLIVHSLFFSGSAYAANSLRSLAIAGTEGINYSTSRAAEISTESVDRFIVANPDTAANHVSVFDSSVEPAAVSASEEELSGTTPNSGKNSNLYLWGACGAVLAIGLGLSVAGMVSSKQRALPAFGAGIMRVR
jgi:hypothetical protein